MDLKFFCFKQVPLNIKEKFDFLYYLIHEERLLLVVKVVVNSLVDKPSDFHDTTSSVSPSLFKV